ncbi:MAG: SRPBCC family protein [Trueperaceae bacterium]
MYSAEASVMISSDPQRTWAYISDYKNFDKFMSNVREIKMLDEKTSEWHLSGPLGIPVAWKAVTTTFDAPTKLAWQSLEGSLETNGYILVESSGAGSKVTVNVRYNPPGGAIGEAFTKIFKDPQKMLESDLEKLGELVAGYPVDARNEKLDTVRTRA